MCQVYVRGFKARCLFFDKKLRVTFDWSLDLIFSKDLVQFLRFEHLWRRGLTCPAEDRHYNGLAVETEEQTEAFWVSPFPRQRQVAGNPKEEKRA